MMNEGIQLIPYSLPQEKQIILHYANLLGDTITKEIIERDRLENNNEEAEHLANFFGIWLKVRMMKMERVEKVPNIY